MGWALTSGRGCRSCQSTQQNTSAGLKSRNLTVCGCLTLRSCSTLWPHCFPMRTAFVLHCGMWSDEADAVVLKCFPSLCLGFKLFGGVVIRGRQIFGYSTFWLRPHSLCWDDAVGLCPSLPLRWGFSQLSLFHLLLSMSLPLPLRLTDLDLAAVLSKCETEFGCDMLLGHYSSSWRYMCRDRQCLAVLVRPRNSDSSTKEFTQRAT